MTTPVHPDPANAGRLSRRTFQGGCLAGALLLVMHRDGDVDARAEPDLAALELAQAANVNTMCSGRNSRGVGLLGEYFERPDWKGARLAARTDPVVDFDASLGWPQGDGARPRSVRWSGWLMASLSGDYRFHVDVNGARVVVARQSVVGVDVPDSSTLHLDTGRFYPVSIGIARLDLAPDARVRFEWTAPFGARYVVPRPLLHLPTDTVAVAT